MSGLGTAGSPPAPPSAAAARGSLRRVPLVLAASSIALTALVLSVAGGLSGPVLAWGAGSLFLAFALWRGPTAGPALLIAAALVAVSAAGAGYAWWKDRPPFAASAVRATTTLRFTDETTVDRDARALGVTGLTGFVDIPTRQRLEFSARHPGRPVSVAVGDRADDHGCRFHRRGLVGEPGRGRAGSDHLRGRFHRSGTAA
jgi:hypothetical protein